MPRQAAPWVFTGIGDCSARNIEVRPSRRYACPRYEFRSTRTRGQGRQP